MSLIGLLVLALGAFEPEGVVRLAADVSVERSSVTLGEIATLDGMSDSHREVLAALSFGSSAPPGRTRSLSGETIRTTVRRTIPGMRVEVPSEVRVHTAYRKVTRGELRDRFERAIQLRMPWPLESTRFSDWSVPEGLLAPPHAHRTIVRFKPSEDFLGRVAASVSVTDPEDAMAPRLERTLAVTINVRQPVVVIAKQVRRGAILDSSSVRLEERDLRELPRGTLASLDEVVGRRVVRAVGPGSPLLRSSLQLDRLVRRNDRVQVEALMDGLDMQLEARALENGVI
ncbi:MAG: flagellar basal body P-ring formation chaperone FlgA, partial [Myxococcota bacterium]